MTEKFSIESGEFNDVPDSTLVSVVTFLLEIISLLGVSVYLSPSLIVLIRRLVVLCEIVLRRLLKSKFLGNVRTCVFKESLRDSEFLPEGVK